MWQMQIFPGIIAEDDICNLLPNDMRFGYTGAQPYRPLYDFVAIVFDPVANTTSNVQFIVHGCAAPNPAGGYDFTWNIRAWTLHTQVPYVAPAIDDLIGVMQQLQVI